MSEEKVLVGGGTLKKKDAKKRKWLRCKGAVETYGISRTKVVELARDCGAYVKINRTVLIDAELFDKYIETFRVPGEDKID